MESLPVAKDPRVPSSGRCQPEGALPSRVERVDWCVQGTIWPHLTALDFDENNSHSGCFIQLLRNAGETYFCSFGRLG